MRPPVWVAKGGEIGALGKEALWTLLIPQVCILFTSNSHI